MDPLYEMLATGLRPLDEAGRFAPDAAAHEWPGGIDALFVVDLEMSGPNAQMHEVLDLGGVRAELSEGLPEAGSWGARVKPRHIGNAITGALKVTGYSPKAWRDSLDLAVALDQFEQAGRGGAITGWGISQDIAFLAESFRRVGRPWPFARVAVDVQPIARAILGGGQVDRFNLGHVADRLGIGRMGEHGALADAYATYDVLVKLVERHLKA